MTDRFDPPQTVPIAARDTGAPSVADVGHRVDATRHELFVSADPEPALRLQFERLKPDFIAVHDIGTASSQRLLAGLAAALGTPPQQLVVRRYDNGDELATVPFVALPTEAGGTLRLYSTDIGSADAALRQALGRLLLGASRLGVLLVGDLPVAALQAALAGLAADIERGPWLNSQLLLLPLGSAATLATMASALRAGDRITVRTTPQVKRPADAWKYLSGSWNRLSRQVVAAGIPMPALVAELQPAASPATAPPDPLGGYVEQALGIAGMVSVCLYEPATRRCVAQAGARPTAALLAVQGALLGDAIDGAASAVGLAGPLAEAAITLGRHHLLLRPVGAQPRLMLHALLERGAADLAAARRRLDQLDAMLCAAAPARPAETPPAAAG